MHHEATRSVAAPAEVVWAILLDVERWPAWTRSMSTVVLDGPFAVGVTARIKQPRFPAADWTVTEVEPGCSFTWESRTRGLVSTATHRVVAGPAGTSTVTLTIDHQGPLAAVVGGMLGPVIRRYVAMEADGLEREATKRGSAP